MRIKAWMGLGLLLAIASIGCTPRSPYLSGFRYTPDPAMVDVLKRGAESSRPPLSVLASVIGVRRGDPDRQIPPAVEIRMRFENNGPASIVFDPRSLELVGGTLQPFANPEPQPAREMSLAPGQTQGLTVFFPFPPGMAPRSPATESLRLRWLVQVDGQMIPQTAYFERAIIVYYDPYY